MNKDEIAPAVDLYIKATENDWRTVQAPEQTAPSQPTEGASEAAETTQLMNVARSILMNENGTVE